MFLLINPGEIVKYKCAEMRKTGNNRLDLSRNILQFIMLSSTNVIDEYRKYMLSMIGEKMVIFELFQQFPCVREFFFRVTTWRP